MTDDPGSAFASVWSSVVAELNSDSDSDSPGGNGSGADSRLTPQQRAWLKLVQPLTIV